MKIAIKEEEEMKRDEILSSKEVCINMSMYNNKQLVTYVGIPVCVSFFVCYSEQEYFHYFPM